MLAKVFYALLGVVVLGAGGFFGLAPRIVDQQMNGVARPAKPPQPSAETRALHQAAFVADLHADSLLWGRDLLARHDRGHVDLPRLADGNVALQVFDAVTKTPKHMNIERNDASTDNIRLLALAQGWPMAAQSDVFQRALFLSRRLDELITESNGTLRWLRNRDDLEELVAQRSKGSRVIGAMLGLEGAHSLERAEDADALYDAGYRLVGLAHFFDNAFAGSAHGVAKGGLSTLGKALVARLERNRVLVDLAHASPATVDDVLAVATRPVLVSHTGVRGTCDNQRNLSDAQLKRIAANGGMVGIGYWPGAVCGADHAAIVRAVKHALSVMGEDGVALGSDFDGAVNTPLHTGQLVELTEALRAAGLTDVVVRKVLGDNVVALLRRAL